MTVQDVFGHPVRWREEEQMAICSPSFHHLLSSISKKRGRKKRKIKRKFPLFSCFPMAANNWTPEATLVLKEMIKEEVMTGKIMTTDMMSVRLPGFSKGSLACKKRNVRLEMERFGEIPVSEGQEG